MAVLSKLRDVLRSTADWSVRASRTRGARKRSVVFLHNNYYHFRYLAAALRRRGWDAIAVSLERPDGRNSPFYHGEDVNLFDEDPNIFRKRIRRFVAEVPRRFRMVHFTGDGMMAVDPANEDTNPRRDAIPWEFLEWRRAGLKVGYTAGGCTDGLSQSSFRKWSHDSCDRCSLSLNGEVCSDMRNLAWGHKREMFCDLIASETLPSADYLRGPKVFREPLTIGLDPEIWRPDIAVPERFREKRAAGEVLIYHAVGNYFDAHYGGKRDYKGTPAIKRAVEKLAVEGLPVRLLFAHDVHSTEVRFLQVQADIVVDQLNAGRYGANARESLMLGRPVVGRIRKEEPDGSPQLSCLQECPIVDADEESIEAVLRDLVRAPERHRELGRRSREYALKWHSVEALAARYEAVYDWVLSGRTPTTAPLVMESPWRDRAEASR